MKIHAWLTFLALSSACGGAHTATTPSAGSGGDAPGAPPIAAVRSATNTYHGVEVVDPYQWLEKDDDAEVGKWASAQNLHARAHLDALPNLQAVTAEVTKLMAAPEPGYGAPTYQAGKLFFLKFQPPMEQSLLVVFNSVDKLGDERVILDPNKLDDEGSLRIDWYSPSPDGSKVALSMSRRGSERGDLYLYDTASGKRLPDRIPHVMDGTAGGSAVWVPDGSGFYYTRYPQEGERPAADMAFYQQVWFHTVGTSAGDDRYELGKELPRIAEIQLALRAETGELLASVQNGDGGDIAHYLRSPDGAWRRLSEFGDGVKGIFFGTPGELFIFSRKDATRGKILRLGDGSVDIHRATEIIAESDRPIDWGFWNNGAIRITASRIYVGYQTGGPRELRAFDHNGKRLADPPQLPVASIGGLTALEGDDLLLYQSTFLVPGGWYRLDAARGTSTKIDRISRPSPVDFSDAEVIREMATSKDGTKVPVNIIAKKGRPRDGSRPCVVTGYGGYGLSMTPGYRSYTRIFLDRDTCFAVANIRGGGEFGDEWHRQGMLHNKQNVFDDFAAVLQHLIDRGYTRAEKLGIMGGSNGGLLMGALLTQHPDRVAAVASAVGIYDALRTELTPNGRFNITEFGTVADEVQFKAMYAYSPYHRVVDGTAYPAILLTHGDNDPRVASWQSRKMAARLQAATSSKRPILLRTSARSGHGAGSLSEAISLLSHRFAFLLHHIGAQEPGSE